MTIFTFCVFLPLSLPQELSALRFSSALGVLCTIILTMVISYQYVFNTQLVPHPMDNFQKSTKIDLNLSNIVEAVPYITFLYLFQPNVPATYFELKTDCGHEDSITKKLVMMDKVLYRSSLFSYILFVIVGINGYLIFASSEIETKQQLWAKERSKDILEADWGQQAGVSIKFSQMIVLFAVVCASPLAVLPAK